MQRRSQVSRVPEQGPPALPGPGAVLGAGGPIQTGRERPRVVSPRRRAKTRRRPVPGVFRPSYAARRAARVVRQSVQTAVPRGPHERRSRRGEKVQRHGDVRSAVVRSDVLETHDPAAVLSVGVSRVRHDGQRIRDTDVRLPVPLGRGLERFHVHRHPVSQRRVRRRYRDRAAAGDAQPRVPKIRAGLRQRVARRGEDVQTVRGQTGRPKHTAAAVDPFPSVRPTRVSHVARLRVSGDVADVFRHRHPRGESHNQYELFPILQPGRVQEISDVQKERAQLEQTAARHQSIRGDVRATDHLCGGLRVRQRAVRRGRVRRVLFRRRQGSAVLVERRRTVRPRDIQKRRAGSDRL